MKGEKKLPVTQEQMSNKITCEFYNLYRNVFWIDCGVGWYSLLNWLSKRIENIILSLPEIERPYVYATQVKEKYGTLRFYMSCCDDKIEDLISQAERRSARTCEVCGSKGKLNEGPWFRVRCSEHWVKEG